MPPRIVSKRVIRWIRDAWQRAMDRYYEGPEAPARFGEIAALFAQENPQATRLDWVIFAAEHAKRAFREGWLRGYEYVERDPEERNYISRIADPEAFADALDPDWRSTDPVLLEYPDGVVPDEVSDDG